MNPSYLLPETDPPDRRSTDDVEALLQRSACYNKEQVNWPRGCFKRKHRSRVPDTPVQTSGYSEEQLANSPFVLDAQIPREPSTGTYPIHC